MREGEKDNLVMSASKPASLTAYVNVIIMRVLLSLVPRFPALFSRPEPHLVLD